MNKTKKLISNTFIFALGTLGSKLLQYLLLPYYTALLSTYEYGIIDNLQNIASLLIPIVSLTIYEAIFRYAMDKDYDSKIVFSIGTIISLSGVIIFFVLTLIFNIILPSTYIWITFIYVIFNIFRTNCSQYVRAIGYTKLFTIDNLFQTLIILLANIMFLSYFNLGITGYMLAYCVGNFISTVFLILSAKLYRDFIFCFPKQISIKMLKFSVPLIPNTICWWISSCSDRFMITSMIGAAVNGLYAIANKIPTVMTIFINIFLQAWQISANDEVNNAKNAIRELGGKIVKIDNFMLENNERNIVIIEKISSTKSKYPRKAGIPSKDPLK